MTSKMKIAFNFTRGSAHYDELASCQRHAASRLDAIISRYDISRNGFKVLELGCGTGFLTEKLLVRFPLCALTATDISRAMLDRCRSNTSGINMAEKSFAVCDFDRSLPGGKYGIIASGMSFQWSCNLAKLARTLRSRLEPEGMLFFSMLVEPTFGSLRETFKEMKIQYPGPSFLTEADVRKAFSGFTAGDFEAETFTERHKGTASFLRHLNRIGAGNPGSKQIMAGQLRKIISRHNERHLRDEFVEAEYRILYGALVK